MPKDILCNNNYCEHHREITGETLSLCISGEIRLAKVNIDLFGIPILVCQTFILKNFGKEKLKQFLDSGLLLEEKD